MGFSLILIYYGGKKKIRTLLTSLNKGAQAFYEIKVQKGLLFNSVTDSCHLQIDNKDFYAPEIWLQNKLLAGVSVDFIRGYGFKQIL